MITLIHGDNVVASRRKMEEIISSFTGEVVKFDGKNIDKNILNQALSSDGLFSDKRLIVVEENILENFTTGHDIVFWVGKTVTASQIKNLKDITNFEFKLPTTIFRLMDSLRTNNGKQLLEIYKQTLNDADAEFIFIMIVRQFRMMFNPSEIKQEWQAAKVRVQAKSFGERKLKEIYRQLLEIDWKNKNSLLPGGLSGTLLELLAWI